jgi:hypothetical protein
MNSRVYGTTNTICTRPQRDTCDCSMYEISSIVVKGTLAFVKYKQTNVAINTGKKKGKFVPLFHGVSTYKATRSGSTHRRSSRHSTSWV